MQGAGSYTVYAVSSPKDKAHLSDAKYATAFISLRSGFITTTTNSASVAKSAELTISGTAQGCLSNVYIWIFGKNRYDGAPGGVNCPALAGGVVHCQSPDLRDRDRQRWELQLCR